MKMINPTTGEELASYINELYGADGEAWGDSLIYQSWATYLAENTGRTFVFNGYGGKTASYIRDQFIANGDITKSQIFYVGRNGGSTGQIIDDIRMMVAYLEHDRFLILMPPNGGYYPEFNDGNNYSNYTELERRLQDEYPNNFLNTRKAIINGWEFGNIRLNNPFTQPNIGSNVQIDVTDANFLNNQNPSDIVAPVLSAWKDQIRIGDLTGADLYEIVSVDSSTLITVKLLESNVVAEGATVENPILYEGGQAYVQVLQELDWQCYNKDTIPSTFRKDSVHPTDIDGREFIAKIVGRFLNRKFI